jgi:cell division protein FtsI (penicillin-binding protein 3)
MSIRGSILIRVQLVFLVLVIFASSILIALFNIQVIQGEKYQKLAENYGLKIIEVEPVRGSILSDDGSILAVTLPKYRIAIDPSIASDEVFERDIQGFSVRLANYLNQNPKDLEDEIKNARFSGRQYMLLSKKYISHDDYEVMKSWPLINKGRRRGGVIFEKKEQRFRPEPELARRTVGFTRINSMSQRTGKGLEVTFDKELMGEKGEALYQKIAGKGWIPVSNEDEVIIPATEGYDIQTTIDTDLQDYGTQILKDALVENEAAYGTLVLMEVETGHIKAMVNLGKNATSYGEIYNYAVGSQGVSEPGSTFKLISMLALLEQTSITPNDSIDATNDAAFRFYSDCVMRDATPYGYGVISVQQAFEKSSNIAISKMMFGAFNDNPQPFLEYLDKLNLREPLGFQMMGEGHPIVGTPEEGTWSGCSIPWMAIGYELKLSPLQVLAVYNAVANKGKMITPIIVKRMLHSMEVVKEFEAEVLNEKIATEENLTIIRDMLEGVVERGTAKNIKSDQYKIAGKTGTTQKLADGQYSKRYYTSFAGYFPAEEPKYSCIVVIDDPAGPNKYGGKTAAPVFRKMADKVFATRIKKPIHLVDSAKNDRFPVIRAGYLTDLKNIGNELQLPYSSNLEEGWIRSLAVNDSIKWVRNPVVSNRIPDVRGMTLKDALFLLENLGLEVRFSGNGRVQRQSLPPGANFKKGNTIYINLS